jgi:hypothetical protein
MAETPKKSPAPAPKKTPEKQPQQKLSLTKSKLFARTKAAISWLMPNLKKDPKKEIPQDIKEEELKTAKGFIEKAIKTIQEQEPYKTAITKYGITLKPADYYLPVVIKESRAKNSSASNVGAKGYFQLTSNGLNGIKEAYEITMSKKSIKDEEKNCIAGILYFHYCHDFYPKRWKIECNENEKGLMAALMYNAGPTLYRNLYRFLGEQKSYREIEKFLSSVLISQLPKVIEDTPSETYSRGYRVYYYSNFAVIGSLKGKKVSINGKSYSAERIVQGLHYARIIQSIRRVKKYSA